MKNQVPDADTTDLAWRSLYKVGGAAAWILGLLMFSDIAIFVVWPPPGNLLPTRSTVLSFFALFHDNWLIGLLDLDLMGLVTYAFLVPVLLALFMALRRACAAFVTIATIFALIGIAMFFSANPAFAMLSLSSQYAAATSDAQRLLLEASGLTLLTTFYVTVFGMSYIIVAAAMLVIAIAMLRSDRFSRATAYMGMLANAMMLIGGVLFIQPMLGALFSLVGAVVFGIWVILIGRKLRQLEAGTDGPLAPPERQVRKSAWCLQTRSTSAAV